MNRRGFFRRIAGMATAAVVVEIASVLAPPGPSTMSLELGEDAFKFSRGQVITYTSQKPEFMTGRYTMIISHVDYARGIVTVSA